MSKKIEIKDFPRNWLPLDRQSCYKVSMLTENGECAVEEELKQIYKQSKLDFKGLMSTLALQACSDSLLKNKKRLSLGRGSDMQDILELKPSTGNARLFCFIDKTNSKIIVCTNTFWKTKQQKNKRKHSKQNKAFEKARDLRNEYYTQRGEL